MKNKLCLSLLVLCVGSAAGCSDDPVDAVPYCSASTGDAICEPPGFPFMTEAGFRSDACPGPQTCTTPESQTTTMMTQPLAGQVCMKGMVVSPNGFSWLIFSVSHWNKANTHIVDVMDAKALGITGVQFTVDRPPASGLNLFATTAHQRDCVVPGGCLTAWNLISGPRSNLFKVLDHSETVTAPFADFRGDDPNTMIDTTQLGHFIFVIQPGVYDFCISNFKFLDAQGAEVLPEGTLGTDGGTDAETDATTG